MISFVVGIVVRYAGQIDTLRTCVDAQSFLTIARRRDHKITAVRVTKIGVFRIKC